MKKIPLTQGQFTKVDDADYDRLVKFKWCAQKHESGGFYANRWHVFEGLYDTDPSRLGRCKRVRVTMSRQIMGLCSEDSHIVDHRNRDKLDNRRENLRICTFQQNTQNRKSGKLKYTGVFPTRYGRWYAMCQNKYIGTYKDEKQAAGAYDEAAKACYGEFACLNFPS